MEVGGKILSNFESKTIKFAFGDWATILCNDFPSTRHSTIAAQAMPLSFQMLGMCLQQHRIAAAKPCGHCRLQPRSMGKFS
jgi:hypothetical protein